MEPQSLPDENVIGRTIGNYVVRQKLGEGGMGAVYLAEHPTIGKKVALKILHPEFASKQDVVNRFFNEAKAVNDIQHSNIVDVLDFGVMPPLVYFVMEFLPGGSLAELLRREAPLAPERALGIALQIADALTASHRAGIVHRDLKPDNVMLIHRGREKDFVKLLDFGIAKLTGEKAPSSRTRTGMVMGTPHYMSPEQCEGKGSVDHRSDIYALGVVLFEMITGRVPFVGEGFGEVLVQHLTQAPPQMLSSRGLIPPHVEQVVLRALEKRPDNRFPNIEQMMFAIADPVGYVEAHGGLAGFRSSALSSASQPTVAMTSTQIAPLTPLPGTVLMPTKSTTLGGAAGSVEVAPVKKRKAGLWIGLVALFAAAGGAVAFVMNRGDGGGGDQVQAATADEAEAPPEPVVKAEEPAKVEEPAKAELPARVEEAKPIQIVIESIPPGAAVLIGKKKIGTTPYTHEVAPSDGTLAVELSLDGYQPEMHEIDLGANTTLEVELEKKTRQASGRRKKKQGDGGGGGDSGGSEGGTDDTMSPFAKKKGNP
jgi:eukaryotic-like serine/threonine-protein kinase